ncbi:MAG: uroporphyrinogen decarboxylase [Alphaproteobacteria bacterium]
MTEKKLLRALAGEALAQPPIWLMRQAGRYLPEYRKVRAEAGSFLDLCYSPRLAVEVTMQPIRRFGFDAAILFSDILVVPHGLGQDVWFVENEGPKLSPVRDTASLKALDITGMAARLAPVYQAVADLTVALPRDVTLIGFSGAPWTVATYMVEGGSSRDFAATKGWGFADPAGFGALIDLLTEAISQHLCAQIEAGAEVVQLFDSWAGVLPDTAFRRWIIEPTRRIVDSVRRRYPDVPVIGFPRGAGLYYAEYAAMTGVTAISLDTTVPTGWAASSLQEKLPVQGNLDPMLLLEGGQPMEDGISHILDDLGHGPFIFNLGHGIIKETPPAHVEQMIGFVRRSFIR